MSRNVWLKREQQRSDSRNDTTLCSAFIFDPQGFPPAASRSSFEQLFRQHYEVLRDILNHHLEPGLVLVAATRESLEASAWFEAEEKGPSAFIVGRHSSADIFLPSDPGLSLRHLAVILRRGGPDAAARFRVLDLRTPGAFADEQGNRLEAVEAPGPILLHCASLSLLFFPTGGANGPWPEDVDEAWSRVPERNYLECAPAQPGRWLTPGGGGLSPEPLPRDARAETLVGYFPGPLFPSHALQQHDRPRGEVLVTSPSGQIALRLGVTAARQGMLLGRYERCDTAGLPVLSGLALSRVHLLLVDVDGVLYAIDTASKNGSWVGAQSFRIARLETGLTYALAYEATVEWRSFH